jgi:hypothetical protein
MSRLPDNTHRKTSSSIVFSKLSAEIRAAMLIRVPANSLSMADLARRSVFASLRLRDG